METPTWLRDHADPAIRDRIAPLRYPGGNELRQTGDPDEQQRDLDAAFDRLRRAHASDEYRADGGGRDHGPQELRRHRLVRRRGPPAGARPARVLEPARVQHLPQPPPARLGARRRRSTSPYGAARAHNRGMVEFCAVDPRLLPDLLRAAGRLRPGAARWPTRRSRWARPRCSSRRGARRATPPATSASTRCGPRRRRRASRSCSTSAAPATSSTRATSATACRSRPTSTAARRTSARSTTWASPDRRRRRWRR